MSKNLMIAFTVLSIYALGYAFNFEAYKAFAVMAFILALDTQIVMAMRAISRSREIDKMLKDLERIEKENGGGQ